MAQFACKLGLREACPRRDKYICVSTGKRWVALRGGWSAAVKIRSCSPNTTRRDYDSNRFEPTPHPTASTRPPSPAGRRVFLGRVSTGCDAHPCRSGDRVRSRCDGFRVTACGACLQRCRHAPHAVAVGRVMREAGSRRARRISRYALASGFCLSATEHATPRDRFRCWTGI